MIHREKAKRRDQSIEATATARLRFATETGMVLRDEKGRRQPVTLDFVERAYGAYTLDRIMSEPRQWHEAVRPLPELSLITTPVRHLNPAAWGDTAA